MGIRREYHEDNRIAWNEATKAHNSHKGDQAKFFREGGDTLFPEELEHLGALEGKKLVHLQCNSGQDSLSLAQHGADVTGVDISDEAVAFAKQLSADSGIPAKFVRADVYDWLAETAQTDERFDLAFSSYGTICWLSDLKAWAAGIFEVLKPGGKLVLVDFHPINHIFDWESPERMYDYFWDGKVQTWEWGVGDYVADAAGQNPPWEHEEGIVGFENPNPSHEFNWTIGDIATAFIDAGFVLAALKEYPYANGFSAFDSGMKEISGRRFVMDGSPNLPLMYVIAGRKPE